MHDLPCQYQGSCLSSTAESLVTARIVGRPKDPALTLASGVLVGLGGLCRLFALVQALASISSSSFLSHRLPKQPKESRYVDNPYFAMMA